MKRFTSLLLIAASPLVALAACSSDETPAQVEPKPDGSTLIDPGDASSTDASVDAHDADARADGATSLCSADHFCHSEIPEGSNFLGVWADGQGIVWAVTVEGDVVRWDGTKWSIHQHLTVESGIFSIFGVSPTDIWVPTDVGLMHGTGATSESLVFAPVTVPGDETMIIKSVWGTGPNDVWAVGGNELWDIPTAVGRVAHFTGPVEDGGGGWSLDDAFPADSVEPQAAWGSPTSGLWIYASKAIEYEFAGVVMRRLPGATTWTTVDLPQDSSTPQLPGPHYFTGAGLSSDDSVWLAGFGGAQSVPVVYHGTKAAAGNGNFDWTYTKRYDWDRPISGFFGFAANDTWAMGQSGFLQHWDGTSWKQAATRVGDLPVANNFWAAHGVSKDDFWVVGDAVALHRTNADKP